MALNASLRARSITASLTSGLPRRETWTSEPLWVWAPGVSVRVAKRLAVDHTPMIALGSVAPDGVWPPRARAALGTWIASELTLKPAVLSSIRPEPTPSRSKMPRSTKKPSSRCPANTRVLPASCWMPPPMPP